MQADEFEKKIRAKMEEFELVPDSEVWKQVSIRINQEKKKRRVVFYWLFTGFALLAGTLLYWLINNENNTKLVINEVKNNVSKEENYKLKQSVPNSLRNLKKVQKAYSEKNIVRLKKGELKHVLRTETKIPVQSESLFTKGINRKPVLLPQKKYGNVYKEDKKYKQRSLPSHKFYNPELAKGTAPFKNISANKKANFKKDTLANTAAKETIQIKREVSKKLSFGFTIYSGISDNVSNLLESQDKSFLESYSPILSGNQSYLNSNINAATNFKKGFSFGVGIYIRKQFTKKISLSAGIDYHLYTVKSVVGSRVIQQARFYDSLLRNSTLVNSYYTISNSGYYTITNSENYSNKYHLVQLPINLGYQINKNQEKPLLISAGISPGYLLSSNALYANPSANVYYVDKEKFSRFQLLGQIELSFAIKSSSNYLLSAGPAARYGFTNATKSAGGDQHLFFTGVKANIILK